MSIAADSWVRKHRISVDEYYRMAEVGLLAPDARVELIEGEIIDMAPIGSKPAYAVDVPKRLLMRAVVHRAVVGVQRPIRLSSDSEPQPDLVLLKPPAEGYMNAHPAPSDVLLLIEVSDGTLRYDREIQVPLYARHLIPEVWLIDITSKQLHCMRKPGDEGYTSITEHQDGYIQLATLPDVRVDLSGLLTS
jgi:Uma2 family endonuclease